MRAGTSQAILSRVSEIAVGATAAQVTCGISSRTVRGIRSGNVDENDEVRAAAQQQIDRMRAVDYDHSAVLGFKVTTLNATSALYQGEYSWRRARGDEISRPRLTYLLTNAAAGPRISALVVQSG
jgi:hypothetical protein